MRPIPPIYVKPFVKPQKNDAADVSAIAEAALRPNLHYVAVKSAERQTRTVAFLTHIVCRTTHPTYEPPGGHLGEFGLVVAKAPANLKAVAGLIEDKAEVHARQRNTNNFRLPPFEEWLKLALALACRVAPSWIAKDRR